MTNPQARRLLFPRKGDDWMPEGWDLLTATWHFDLHKIKKCLHDDPNSIQLRDSRGNNAMHICVYGGAALKAPDILGFFLEATDVDLLQKNKEGLDPLEAAQVLNDEAACRLIEPQWHKQLNTRFPERLGAKPEMKVIITDDGNAPHIGQPEIK